MKKTNATFSYKCYRILAAWCAVSLFCISGYLSLHHYCHHVPPRLFRPIPDYFDAMNEDVSRALVERQLYNGCKVPPGDYKAWNQGVVTAMKPQFHKNCSLLFQGDAEEVKRVLKQNKLWDRSQFDKEFYDRTIYGNCAKIRSEFMHNLYTTREELDFPLAFSMNVYENPQQILRFLKVIYRPHNLYCLHYDQKSSAAFKRVIKNLAKCLGNVIIPPKIYNVVWGCYTNIEAQISCTRALYAARDSYPWRYAISLCGKELPLRTNREIVEILRRLNGTSAIELHPMQQINSEIHERFTHKFVIGYDNKCHETREYLGPVPHGLEIKKNLAYIAMSPEFVHFLLHNKTALDLYEYMKGALIAEEHYYSTIFWMKGVPGGYSEQVYPLIPTVADYIWMYGNGKCSSRVVHGICIVGSADLHQVKYEVDLDDVHGPFFHNKYFMEWDHTVMDCLEEQLVIRNKREYIKECSGSGISSTQLS